MLRTLNRIAVRLAHETDGAIVSAELMLIATILVIGMIVGLKSLRDSVVSELADVAQALANVDQSYSYSGVVGHASFSAGATFADLADFCDTNSYANVQQSKCVDVCVFATQEGFGMGHHGRSSW